MQLSLFAREGLLPGCRAQASYCGGFLLRSLGSRVQEHQQLWLVGSAFVASGLESTGSLLAVHGLSCSVACGIFPDSEIELCILN